MLEGNSLAKLFKYEFESEYGIHSAFDNDLETTWGGRPLTEREPVFFIGATELKTFVRCLKFYEIGETPVTTYDIQMRTGSGEWRSMPILETKKSSGWTTLILRIPLFQFAPPQKK